MAGKYDFLYAGVKVIGIYFGVTALGSLIAAGYMVLLSQGAFAGAGLAVYSAFVQPAVHLAAAYVLVFRTRRLMEFWGDAERPEPPGRAGVA